MVRRISEHVPEWQMLGQPVALAAAQAAGFEEDPPPLTADDLDDRPVLVLDFDGVVSPLPNTLADKYERGRQFFQAGNKAYVYVLAGYGMGSNYWVSKDLMDAGSELEKKFQIVWASSWDFVCRPLGTLFGVSPDLPWIELIDGYATLERARAIRRIVGEDRPVVWCDDQQTAASQRYMSERAGPTLCIRPAKRYGLRAKHLDRIFTFSKQLGR